MKKILSTFNFKLLTRESRLKKQSGFTLIELIVVITIFAALTSVVLFNFSGFDESIKLQNLSQQIALQIKRAQTAGSQGQIPVVITLQSWKPTYGVYFESQSQMFTYFIDVDDEMSQNYKMYDGSNAGCGISGATTECLAEIFIATGQEIEKLCVNSAGIDPNTESCTQEVDKLHITYTRPSLEAFITSEDPQISLVNNAQIIIRSPKDQRRMITVWPIGQISVK